MITIIVVTIATMLIASLIKDPEDSKAKIYEIIPAAIVIGIIAALILSTEVAQRKTIRIEQKITFEYKRVLAGDFATGTGNISKKFQYFIILKDKNGKVKQKTYRSYDIEVYEKDVPYPKIVRIKEKITKIPEKYAGWTIPFLKNEESLIKKFIVVPKGTFAPKKQTHD